MLPGHVARLDSREERSPWNYTAASTLHSLRCDPRTLRTTCTDESGNVAKQWSDPLEALAWMERDVREADGRADVRWIGYLSYDLGRLFESLPSRAQDDLNVPLFAFVRATRPSLGAMQEHEATVAKELSVRSTFTRRAYEAAVARVIEYIRAGDVFQVNLSQRFTAPLSAHPWQIYQRLQEKFPATHAAYLEFDDFVLISNSPELFLNVSRQPDGSRAVMTRPIKGTRPRLAGMDVELRDSIKDQAELNMIVDVERNDLGRVCEIGSVKVTQPRAIEALPTVYHGVATIEGTLRRDVGFVELLRATFPTGSITGAPKIRAMEIIDELEPVRRGPYCGAIGYLAANGEMQFNVAIRTMIAKDGLVHIPVGGGVVADSDPAAEYEETLVKAHAMFSALGISLSV